MTTAPDLLARAGPGPVRASDPPEDLVIAGVVGARPGEGTHGHGRIDVPTGVVTDRALDAVTDVRIAAAADERLVDSTVEERPLQRHTQSPHGWISC
jgi:hypothetical protein